MEEKNDLIKVGKYDLRYNELLSIDIEELDIFRSKGLPAHMVKRKHYNCLKYIDYLPEIIENPDYIGINPNENDKSIEFIKKYSKNVLVDGITIVNPDHYTVFGGETTGLTIKNLKSFSCKGWSDGIDLMCCNEVLIDNVFMRNSDDCIAVYAHRWNYYGGSKNITLQNSILWADIAHPVNIGGHGNSADEVGETVENITVRNIDILEHDEDDPLYQGCMTIDCGDKNLVRNILFDNIRVESIQEGRLFHVNVRFNPKYDKQPGRGIEDVIFRNITYNGVGENPSLLKGLDENRRIKNVTFDNVMINGVKMKNIDGFITNEFVKGIKVK